MSESAAGIVGVIDLILLIWLIATLNSINYHVKWIYKHTFDHLDLLVKEAKKIRRELQAGRPGSGDVIEEIDEPESPKGKRRSTK